MKDTQLRGIILQRYYDCRRQSWYLPTPSDLGVQVDEQEILRICDQLSQHGLLEWKSLKASGEIVAGMGKITAQGVSVVEGEVSTGIRVELVQNHTVNISGSSNVVVGNNNSQTINSSVIDLVNLINSMNATGEQKAEAKGLLRKFLEHPLLASIAGGAVGLLG
jgi:hypothetical protein